MMRSSSVIRRGFIDSSGAIVIQEWQTKFCDIGDLSSDKFYAQQIKIALSMILSILIDDHDWALVGVEEKNRLHKHYRRMGYKVDEEDPLPIIQITIKYLQENTFNIFEEEIISKCLDLLIGRGALIKKPFKEKDDFYLLNVDLINQFIRKN